MKAAIGIVSAVVLSIGLVACGNGSPVAPSVSNLQPIEQAQLRGIVWGTGAIQGLVILDVDTLTGNNQSLSCHDVKGTLTALYDPLFGGTFNLSYGSVSTGPASVTIPVNVDHVDFTIHTCGTGTDAHVSVVDGSDTDTVLAHKTSPGASGIVWGT